MSAIGTSPSKLREKATKRLLDAMTAVDWDADIFKRSAIAEWIADAEPRQNRKRMIKVVLSVRAARVTNKVAMRDARLNGHSAARWSRIIYQAERENPALSVAIESAVIDIRNRMVVNALRAPSFQEPVT